jgi:hypothetical protein
MIAKRRTPQAATRRGFQALELFFAVPLMALLVLAALQYGRTMMIRSCVAHAATVAAREAAKGGGIADVAQAVRSVLAVHGIAISDKPGSGTKITVQDGGKTLVQYGDPSMTVLPSPTIRHDEILATVWVKSGARRADGRKLLGPAGGVLGLADGRQLSASSLAKKQRPAQPTAPAKGPESDKTIVLASHDATARGK